MEPPENILKRRPTLPAALANLVMRMIEKRPADRPQSAHDVVDQLDALTTPSGGLEPTVAIPAARVVAKPSRARTPAFRRYGIIAGLIALVVIGAGIGLGLNARRNASRDSAAPPTIAVLPFENLGNAEGQFFTDGIGEEITNRLASLHGLRVIGRQSVKAYAAANKPAQQIANELGVKFILTGTVRWDKAADGKDVVRVSPALIRGSDGTQVWSNAYQTVLSGIFVVQSSVATEVASALDLTLLSPERALVTAKPTDNVDAYSDYLRGLSLLSHSFDNASQRQALNFFEKAVKADPKFALAYAAMASAHTQLFWAKGDVSQHRLELAKAALDRALQIDPQLPEAHLAMAVYYYHGFYDYTNALRELAIAKRRLPNDSRIALYEGSIKRRQGKYLESLVDLRRAVELEPRSSTLLSQVAASEYFLGQYADAERTADRGIALDPKDGLMPMYKAFTVIAARGDTATAMRTLRTMYAAAPQTTETLLTLDECVWPAITDPVLRNVMIAAKWTPDYGAKGDFMSARTRLYDMLGDSAKFRSYADSAAAAYSSDIAQRPTAAEYYLGLAVAEARRGRKAAAFAALDRADTLRAATQDAFMVSSHLVARANVLMLTGDQDGAVAILEKVLSGASNWSPIMVRLDPMWSRLRGNPRFQKLVARA
jgi:TolB-like protein/Tfp pilus assembly protein PilF